MFLALIANVGISVLAFFVVSVIGLLIIPVLIDTYGLGGFGLIGIARLFLPTTGLAIFDLGYVEISTNSIATTRMSGDWGSCMRLLGLNILVAVVVGLAAGTCLFILATWIPSWFGVAAVHQGELTEVLRFTALLLPLLMGSLVAEGVLKGFEAFRSQRLVEVISALSYAFSAVWAAKRHLDFRWICYGLLASLLLRAVLAAWLAAGSLRFNRMKFASWTLAERNEFIQRARGLLNNKLIGVAQAQAPSFLVSILFGPVALGGYDALTRLSRFAKSVLALLSSTVQPVAARIDNVEDEQSLARLGRLGLIVVACLAGPILGLAVAFSEPLLRLWLGPGLSSQWVWQAAYFIPTTLGALASFGCSALLGRMKAVAAMNRATLFNVIVIVVAGLSLAPSLGEYAFIASQVAASIVTVPWLLSIIADQIGLNRSTFIPVVRIYTISIILAVPVALTAHQDVGSPAILILAMAAWGISCWVICLVFGLPVSLRTRGLSAINAMLHARLGT